MPTRSTSMASAVVVPARPDWDQGDIVSGVYFPAEDAKRPAVLVTPACDIDQDKVGNWTFVGLFPDTLVARSVVESDLRNWHFDPDAPQASASLSAGKREQLRKRLAELIGHKLQRYHWLPVAIGTSPAHVADFTHVTTLSRVDVRANVTRVASLASSWREQLPARYAAYMGRVGPDDFHRSEIDEHVDRLTAAVTAPSR